MLRFRPAAAVAATAAVLLLPASAPAADWPMFHAGPLHAGTSPERLIRAGTVRELRSWWQANTGAPAFSSPVVARVDGMPGRLVVVGNQEGTVSAYRAATGERVWAHDLPAAMASSAAIVRGVVYFGAHDGGFYALDATTGDVLCRHELGGVSTAAPAPGRPDGEGLVLYVGDNGASGNDDGGAVWAVNGVDPDAAPDCGVRWSYSAFGEPAGSQPLAGSWSPPAYVRTRAGRPLVVFGSSSPDNAVYALDGRTGARVWRFGPPTRFSDADFGAAPTVSAPGRNGFAGGVVYAAGKNRFVYALGLATGVPRWQTNLDRIAPDAGGATRSTPALAGRRLVLGYGAGVLALSARTGRPLWTTEMRRLSMPEVLSSPAVSGPAGRRVAIVQDTAGVLRALNVRTGRRLWSRRLGPVGFSSPAIAGGRVYVAAGDGLLHAFGRGERPSAPPRAFLRSPADGAEVDHPQAELVVRGVARDDVRVEQVLVAVRDDSSGRWWDAEAGGWARVFSQWPAALEASGDLTAWTAGFRPPLAGGPFSVQVDAVDGDGQHVARLRGRRFLVRSVGDPPDTALTTPQPGQRFAFARDPGGNPVRESLPITISGTASDAGGAPAGVARVMVEVRNREHDEYWCGPAGCPGTPDVFWRSQRTALAADLASPGAVETAWTASFLSYDHPHTYAIRSWAVDQEGRADPTPANVFLICVRDPDDFSCHG